MDKREQAIEILKDYEKKGKIIQAFIDMIMPDHQSADDKIILLDIEPDPLCPMAWVYEVDYPHKKVTPKHQTGATSNIRFRDKHDNYITGACYLCHCPGEYMFFGSCWKRTKEWEEFYKDCKTYQQQVDKWKEFRGLK